MILVADSGSTKADWVIVDKTASMQKFSSAGFNPYFHDHAYILKELHANSGLQTIASQIKEVYFFGAGCSSAERNFVIEKALMDFFENAKVFVDSDMIAAVRATCGSDAGIVGILGTGSNSCYFDGEMILPNNFGLGFIMADEGGGSYFGRKLIADYLYGLLPEHLNKKFADKYEMSKAIMLENVYNKPRPNVWLASFANFLTDNREDEFVKAFIKQGIEEFFRLYICSYKDFKNTPVHFVGTIAYYFDEVIRAVGKEKEVNVKKIIRHPINHLAEYYLEKME
ncbi:MAG: N-acetylglucosamine kinase [Bacteroidetes bacterium]|nr:N-acetylglucosamine kinase [Bacteroidota bacterium]